MSTPAVAGIICLPIQCCKNLNYTSSKLLAIKNNIDKKRIETHNELFLKVASNEKNFLKEGGVQLVAIDNS